MQVTANSLPPSLLQGQRNHDLIAIGSASFMRDHTGGPTTGGSSISWSVVETVANRAAVSFDIRAKLIRSFSLSVGAWNRQLSERRPAGPRIRDCVLMNPFKVAYRLKP